MIKEIWLFSGTIIAVLGHEIDGGKFFVEDYCYSELPYQPQPDLDLALTKGEDRFINFLKCFFSSCSRVHHYDFSEYFSILLGEKARKLAVYHIGQHAKILADD